MCQSLVPATRRQKLEKLTVTGKPQGIKTAEEVKRKICEGNDKGEREAELAGDTGTRRMKKHDLQHLLAQHILN